MSEFKKVSRAENYSEWYNYIVDAADLAQHSGGKVAGAAGNIKCALTRPQPGQGEGEMLPQTMHAERHEVVHDIVLTGHRPKYRPDALCLIAPGDLFESEISLAVGVIHSALSMLDAL